MAKEMDKYIKIEKDFFSSLKNELAPTFCYIALSEG
jgi:hypothetical protein